MNNTQTLETVNPLRHSKTRYETVTPLSKQYNPLLNSIKLAKNSNNPLTNIDRTGKKKRPDYAGSPASLFYYYNLPFQIYFIL
jgi:hypothetical protein